MSTSPNVDIFDELLKGFVEPKCLGVIDAKSSEQLVEGVRKLHEKEEQQKKKKQKKKLPCGHRKGV